MTQPHPGLDAVFEELSITQYLDAFIDQGFDSWETILDISESDLDTLGVKLGHRRKLQRRIANYRGIAPDVSLAAISEWNTEDAITGPSLKAELPRKRPAATATKRKYRRHPKPDENAPERPPSAYVLFSNKMREVLKGRNLTFTEMAKLIGENWQNLARSEKDPFESQAQAAKDRYANDLAEYKKTPEHKMYMDYLLEFKAKYAHQAHDKASKRVQLSDTGESCGAQSDPRPSRSSMNESAVDRLGGSERPPSSQPRNDSIASSAKILHQAAASPLSYRAPGHEPSTSPRIHPVKTQSSETSPSLSTAARDHPSFHHSRHRSGRHRGPLHLPPLSDMVDSRNANLTDDGILHYPAHGQSDSSAPASGSMGDRRRPNLRHDGSSAGSSSTSSQSHPQTPSDANLPIHALLLPRESLPYDTSQSIALYQKKPFAVEQQQPHQPQQHSPPGNGAIGKLPSHEHRGSPPSVSFLSPPRQPPLGPHGIEGPPADKLLSRGKVDASLDGMSALLRAGEIVNRRAS